MQRCDNLNADTSIKNEIATNKNRSFSERFVLSFRGAGLFDAPRQRGKMSAFFPAALAIETGFLYNIPESFYLKPFGVNYTGKCDSIEVRFHRH